MSRFKQFIVKAFNPVGFAISSIGSTQKRETAVTDNINQLEKQQAQEQQQLAEKWQEVYNTAYFIIAIIVLFIIVYFLLNLIL